MKQLHVLFVCEYYPPHIGGVETFFYELRKALVKRGHRVDVVTSAQPGAPRVEKDEGGVIYRVAVPRVVDRYAFAALALPRVMIASRKVDIIHCTTYTSIPPAWLASKILRKKTVLSVHEVLGRDFVRFVGGSALTGAILGIFERGLLRFGFDKTVAVSKSTQRRLPRRHKVRSTVIYHGIDEIFSPGSAV
ncbi:glycosyltransferase family 4 protein, partial [Patescibacteria group bacterium]|nr:glycosyltransferase family 4 protein [Patescibacteria group bacterium]